MLRLHRCGISPGFSEVDIIVINNSECFDFAIVGGTFGLRLLQQRPQAFREGRTLRGSTCCGVVVFQEEGEYF
jgi:hypothetical protein